MFNMYVIELLEFKIAKIIELIDLIIGELHLLNPVSLHYCRVQNGVQNSVQSLQMA